MGDGSHRIATPQVSNCLLVFTHPLNSHHSKDTEPLVYRPPAGFNGRIVGNVITNRGPLPVVKHVLP